MVNYSDIKVTMVGRAVVLSCRGKSVLIEPTDIPKIAAALNTDKMPPVLTRADVVEIVRSEIEPILTSRNQQVD